MESNKNALSLLSEYGGDSSEDEVPLGRVSTKRAYKDEEEKEHTNTTKRLLLPSIITIDKKDEYIDDPSFHDGRIRSFPHERDSWATYVYIPFDLNEGVQHVVDIVLSYLKQFKHVNDHHISLTKVVVLRHHWIESFINTLKESFTSLKSFIVMFDGLEVYCNEDRTRTFIGLQAKTGCDMLEKLVSILDECLQEFRLPTFYKEKKFHMSIAWCLGDQEDDVRTVLPQLNSRLYDVMNNCSEHDWYIFVDRIQCKVGNKHFTFGMSYIMCFFLINVYISDGLVFSNENITLHD